MVIAEAMRTFTYLNLFGYRVDSVIVNRLLPSEVTDPYFARWKELQAKHLATIESAFSPVPLLRSRLRDRELIGAGALASIGEELYGTSDPASVLFTDDPMTISKEGEGYRLSLRLPFARKEDVDLSTKGEELFVRVGSYRRTIVLPAVLASRSVVSATMKDDRLDISFERGAADG
jgi:arsenite-transporting ATPase